MYAVCPVGHLHVCKTRNVYLRLYTTHTNTPTLTQGEERANVPPKPYTRVDDKERPDEAFVTERAVRAGRANAASGRIMVNVPNDHFGPIPAEADPRGLVWR